MARPSKLLHTAGIMLYGPVWLLPLAARLGVSPRVVKNWTNGKFAIPPGIWAELLDDPGLASLRHHMKHHASSGEQSGSSRRP
jgi:hypothetical protein